MSRRAGRAGVALLVAGVLLATGGVALALHRHRPVRPPMVSSTDVGRVPPGAAAAGRGADRRRPAQPAGAQPAGAQPAGVLRAGVLRAGSRLVVHGEAAPIGAVRVVDHELQIPRDPRRVGWWRGSAAPGTPGTVVIAGHVNYAGVTGVLAVVPQLRPGERVTITGPHRRIRYRVTGVRSYPKRTGLPADIFTAGGPPRLVLITCGGAFDAGTGNYVDNLVAYAVPLRGVSAVRR